MADVKQIKKGQTDWHIPLNENFAALNSELAAPDRYTLVATGDSQITAANPYGVEVVLNAGNLDTGRFTVGKNYYVFVSIENNLPVYRISLNKKFDTGHLIGGFHFGRARRTNTALDPINTSGTKRGNGWEANIYEGVVPRGVWTLTHRPKCEPEGMVYLGGSTWVDIYLSSDDGKGGLASQLGKNPLTGTEGLNWYDFNERAMVNGKRLLSYPEWLQMAFGSPGGNDANNTNAWTATTNTGRAQTGTVERAVSSVGCVDAVGNVWEWVDEFISRMQPSVIAGNGTFAASDGARGGKTYTGGNGHGTEGAWNWDATSPFPDGYGNIYEFHDWSLVALLAGGGWSHGVRAGARAVNLNNYPWDVTTSRGARCACDSL